MPQRRCQITTKFDVVPKHAVFSIKSMEHVLSVATKLKKDL